MKCCMAAAKWLGQHRMIRWDRDDPAAHAAAADDAERAQQDKLGSWAAEPLGIATVAAGLEPEEALHIKAARASLECQT